MNVGSTVESTEKMEDIEGPLTSEKEPENPGPTCEQTDVMNEEEL